jgi:class 3 adenylate cyclase
MGSCPGCAREVPAGGYRFCPWCGSSTASSTPSQRKTVTILLADLVGSTELGSSLDPELLGRVLSAYWSVARTAVERHGGTVAKYIGDAVVGLFGVPVSHEDDALRAARAATDILEELWGLNEDLLPRVGVKLAVRIGVNTGPAAIAEPLGDVSLLAGDVANVGARLEQSAAPGTILVGEETYRLIRNDADCEQVPLLRVKGKAEPLSAYRLIRVSRATEPMRRRRFSGPLVGRDSQLSQARTVYATAVDEPCCAILTVVGSPGIGKSRLVEELLSPIRPEAFVLEGRCLPYGEGITFWPLAQMLHRLRDGGAFPWRGALGDEDHGSQIASGLETIMGRSQWAGAGEMAWAFRRLVEIMGKRRPVVVVVDDIQWAEPALLDLLTEVVQSARGVPLLLVCMARPEFLQEHPSWLTGAGRSATTVLSPLSPEDGAVLADRLLGGDIGSSSLQQIWTLTEGVPLFIEELIASFADDGLLVAGPGGSRVVGDLASASIPPSVRALLAARLDRLTPADRAVVDAAAVIGQTFYPDAIVALAPRVDLAPSLRALVRADLIRPVEADLAGHAAYSFVHLLVRDAAYEAIPKVRRARAHESAARWLDRAGVGTYSPEIVAAHLERAVAYRAELGEPDHDLSEEAARRLVSCARRSQMLGDPSGALGLLSAASALVPSTSATGVSVTLTTAEIHLYTEDYGRAAEWAARAEEDAGPAGLLAARWRARLVDLSVRMHADPDADLDAAADLADEAIAALTVLDDQGGLARACDLKCDEVNMRGRLTECAEFARRGLRAARISGDYLIMQRLIFQTMVPFFVGHGTLQEEESAVAEITAQFADDPLVAEQISDMQVALLTDQGQSEAAVRLARPRAVLALEQGNTQRAMLLLALVSENLRGDGDLDGALLAMTEAIAILERCGETGMRSTLLAEAAIRLTSLGRIDDARGELLASRALATAGDLVNPIMFAIADGLLHAHDRDSEASERCFAEARQLLAGSEFGWCEHELRLAHSVARQTLGDVPAALSHAREALAFAEDQGIVPRIRIARRRVSECEDAAAG